MCHTVCIGVCVYLAVAGRGGGVLESGRAPLLAHDVDFLTLSPKLDPVPPLRGGLISWTLPFKSPASAPVWRHTIYRLCVIAGFDF